ncbi:MAG: FHA domain-containing protein [Verrucomicrobia bacterium]|nr:FHA domain-containing protein [Verrucomicrobiota bacterium]
MDSTTVGRVEDNAFQIPDVSVSSHHCEILLKGAEVVVKDLNSTNGTYIDGSKVTEASLKPGQTLRLGQVELQLVVGEGAPAPAPAAAPKAAPSVPGQTVVVQRGVSLSELEKGPVAGFDTANAAFSKKSNQVNRYFLIGGVIIGIAILAVIVFLVLTVK